MKPIAHVVLALMLATAAYGAQDVVSAVHGTIDKIDSGTKTVVVKTADGTRRSLHLLAIQPKKDASPKTKSGVSDTKKRFPNDEMPSQF